MPASTAWSASADLIALACLTMSIALGKRNYLVIIRDNFLLILHKSICCDPSSEPSHRDGSDEGSHHMVLMINKKLTSNTPSYLDLHVYPNT